MPRERRVYLLDPQKLSPETIAVAFAKTSRSPQTFEEIANELTDEKSADFHERWVVGYGHASVAEHAVLHIAVENISRLAVESLESNRLASYTEKSTRYQKWSQEDFLVPPELQRHPLLPKYLQTIQLLFTTYQRSLLAVRDLIAQRNHKLPSESDQAWETRLRTLYVDICRFLLPACSLANVGVTINARVLEHAICKMLSHPLREVQTVGAEIKSTSRKVVPTLVKYADKIPYLVDSCADTIIEDENASTKPDSEIDWCNLVRYDKEAENFILAAASFRNGQQSFAKALEAIKTVSIDEKQRMAKKILGSMDEHDQPIREMEFANFTFDLTLDQGAYYELKRHRMMTQSPQPFTPRLGYATPRAMVDAGMEDEYRNAMEQAAFVYEELEKVLPHIGSYILPNGYNRRVLVEFNLRTAFHLLRLRTEPSAHFSMRRVAQRMAEEIRRVTPILGPYLKVNGEEDWHGIQEVFFHSVR